MATLLLSSSSSALPCHFSTSVRVHRFSALPRTSFHVHSPTGSFKSSVRVQAQDQNGGGGGGGGRERRDEVPRDEVSDLEKALGIENKTVRNVSADKKGPQRRKMSILDALEEQMRVNEENKPPENKFFQIIRAIGDWLIDKTENTGGQDNVVVFAFAVFPIWCFALLVTSGVITLPFDLPFLHDLAQHLKETQ